MGSITPSSEAIRLAILDCDTPLPKMRARYGSYSGMFEALLESSSPNDSGLRDRISVTKYQVDQEDAEYPDLEGVDVLLITGSKHSAYMDIPWINKLASVTHDALQMPKIKVIGVCFGHQIIGRALGAPVSINTKGWEVAVLPIDLTLNGRSLFGKDKLNLQFSHQDVVALCPENVQTLGSTTACAVQGMYQPGNFISLQGHPEFTEQTVREILAIRNSDEKFPQEIYEDAMQRVALEHDGLLVGRVFWRFMLGYT